MILNNQFLLLLIVRQQFRVKNSSNRTSCLIHDDKMIRERCVTISESSFWFSHSSSAKLNTFPSICKQCNTDTVILDHDTTTWRKHGIRIRNFVTENHQLSQSSQKLNHEHVEFCNFQKRFEKSQKYNDRKRERGLYLLQCYLGCLISLSCFSRLDRKEREREKTDIYK